MAKYRRQYRRDFAKKYVALPSLGMLGTGAVARASPVSSIPDNLTTPFTESEAKTLARETVKSRNRYDINDYDRVHVVWNRNGFQAHENLSETDFEKDDTKRELEETLNRLSNDKTKYAISPTTDFKCKYFDTYQYNSGRVENISYFETPEEDRRTLNEFITELY